MIIKSLTRKKGSFRQLMGYINKEADDLILLRNLMAPVIADQDAILSEFERNYQQIPEHKTGVAIHHDIISLKVDNNISIERQKAILMDITYRYLFKKAPHQLTYARLHVAPHHLHIHAMISANVGDKRNRLSKAQFKEIQMEAEKYFHQKYPQMLKSNPPLYYEPELEHELDFDI